PTEESEQNAKWYQLYKRIESEPAVIDSHSNYLLFRDIASMSLVLALIVPVAGAFANVANVTSMVIACGLFVAQYLIAAIAARISGERLVRNVLAITSTR